MRPTRNAPKLSVSNKLLEGVNVKDVLPTLVLDITEMTPGRIAFEMHWVTALQSIAPVFRVVLLADRDVFGAARKAGWPVEHVLSRENVDRLLVRGGAAYRRDRMRIIASQYERPIIITSRQLGSLAKEIAPRLGFPQIAEVVEAWPCWEQLGTTASWRDAELALRLDGGVVFESEEGIVQLSASGVCEDSLLVVGVAEQGSLPQVAVSHGRQILTVEARFGAGSSAGFETTIYNSLARSLGQDLTVVLPWRRDAIENAQADRWVDLGVEEREARLVVLPYYSSSYSVLTGSDVLDWDSASLFAASSRLASVFSLDRLDMQ